jgi:hypothetical protein
MLPIVVMDSGLAPLLHVGDLAAAIAVDARGLWACD